MESAWEEGGNEDRGKRRSVDREGESGWGSRWAALRDREREKEVSRKLQLWLRPLPMARHKGSLVFHRAGQYQTWPDAQPPRWTNRLTPRKNALSWPPRCHVQTLFVPGQKRKRATTSLSTHAELCFRSSYASLSLSYRSPMSFFIRCCFRRSVFIVRSLLASVYFSCNLSPLMMTGKWLGLKNNFVSCRNFFWKFLSFSIELKFLGLIIPGKC